MTEWRAISWRGVMWIHKNICMIERRMVDFPVIKKRRRGSPLSVFQSCRVKEATISVGLMNEWDEGRWRKTCIYNLLYSVIHNFAVVVSFSLIKQDRPHVHLMLQCFTPRGSASHAHSKVARCAGTTSLSCPTPQTPQDAALGPDLVSLTSSHPHRSQRLDLGHRAGTPQPT